MKSITFHARKALILFVVLAVFCAAPALASDEQKTHHRIGGWLGYAQSYDGEDDYNFVSLNPYWSVFLTDPGPDWKWSVELAVEGFYNKYVGDYSEYFEVGFSPTFRFHYGFEKTVSPYAEISIGALYNNMDTDATHSDLMFDVHWGLGLNFRLTQDLYLSAGYRWRHISNANSHRRNPGLDFNQAVVGLSYYY